MIQYHMSLVRVSISNINMQDKMPQLLNMCCAILGYYAIGTILTYAAICRPRPRRNKPDVVTILTLDLRERRQRVKNLLVLINLCPIIEQVQKVIGYRELPEFIPIER